MTKNNCPICLIKKLFLRKKRITRFFPDSGKSSESALTPPMGWSSWNSIRNKINQKFIYETAVQVKEKGISEAGYTYINLDDNWQSSLRDNNGNLQGDLATFSEGIPALVKKINSLGLKVGIYSSNGTHTCEDLPGSLYHESQDAYTFAKWGIEYFKYDFCHNIPLSQRAPLIYSVSIAPKGQYSETEYYCKQAELLGAAWLNTCPKLPGGKYTRGLDAARGALVYHDIAAPQSGKYILTLNIKKKGRYSKFIVAEINDEEIYYINVPPQKHYNLTARFQTEVYLNKGLNKIKLFNPIANRADSAMLQYRYMGECLKRASKRVSEETQTAEKPIVYSICEWGRNNPHNWGRSAGNLWRTTPDIRPVWIWIMMIYSKNVKLYDKASPGGWNDPDMLEVGNGKLTRDENISHFSLWCMMCAPLILGNDIRAVTEDIINIITNRAMIAINQDPLGKSAKRIRRGRIDILVKPLKNGDTAVLFLNKCNRDKHYSFPLWEIAKEKYSGMEVRESYDVLDIWENNTFAVKDEIKMYLKAHGVKVYRILGGKLPQVNNQ